VREMEDGWPSGAGLRGQAPNHPVLRWLKTVVVSVREKAHKMRQVGTGKTFQKPGGKAVGVAVEASKVQRRHRNPGSLHYPGDKPGGSPSTGQAVPGVEAA
jgi:hypothetical protein